MAREIGPNVSDCRAVEREGIADFMGLKGFV